MDAQELAKLYEKYGYFVLRICKDILRQEEDARDAMHETFVKFWRYSDKIRNKNDYISALKKTAVSCAIDFLRSRKRQGRYREAWLDVKEIMHSESHHKFHETWMNKEIVATLFRDVRVDKATIEMAYLYYMDDMTLEEVAKTTGYSRRAVGMKLDRFRSQALKYCRNHKISF